IFSEGAVRMLVHYSRGIPRSINILGHNAMLFAYGSGRTRVTRKDVRSAVREREGRGLVRFEARLPQWMSRERSPRARLSYVQMLLAGVAAGLVFFALGASGAKMLRDTGSDEAASPKAKRQTSAPVREVSAPAVAAAPTPPPTEPGVPAVAAVPAPTPAEQGAPAVA